MSLLYDFCHNFLVFQLLSSVQAMHYGMLCNSFNSIFIGQQAYKEFVVNGCYCTRNIGKCKIASLAGRSLPPPSFVIRLLTYRKHSKPIDKEDLRSEKC